MARRPLVSQGLLILDASRSHSGARAHTHTQNRKALWKNDRSFAETSTWQKATLATERFPFPRRDSNPQFQQPRNGRSTANTRWPLGLVFVCSATQICPFGLVLNYKHWKPYFNIKLLLYSRNILLEQIVNDAHTTFNTAHSIKLCHATKQVCNDLGMALYLELRKKWL